MAYNELFAEARDKPHNPHTSCILGPLYHRTHLRIDAKAQANVFFILQTHLTLFLKDASTFEALIMSTLFLLNYFSVGENEKGM